MSKNRMKSNGQEDQNDEDEEDMISKIINGKMDDIDLRPLKRFNTKWDMVTETSSSSAAVSKQQNAAYHEYPLDLVVCGSRLFATSDISNCVNVWSLEMPSLSTAASNDLIKSIKLSNNSVSIWSMSLDETDR